MLKSHMDAIENSLVATSQIPANAGHSLHKGTPREAFIKDFLEGHLPSSVDIGTGEIIDANSKPNQGRNQFDIVLFRKNYPKLSFGGGVIGFLIESVIATIEVKSTLSEEELKKAIVAARTAKQLVPNFISSFHAGYIPPKVLNFVVAYDGPASMTTVHGWIPKIYTALSMPNPDLPSAEKERISTASESIDGVFILKKGFLYFDNTPFSFNTSAYRAQNPSLKWAFADSTHGNLLLFFLLLQSSIANIEGKWLDARPYIANFSVQGLTLGI